MGKPKTKGAKRAYTKRDPRFLAAAVKRATGLTIPEFLRKKR